MLELAGQGFTARHERARILSLALGHAYGLRIAVALGTDPIRFDLPALALFLDSADGAQVQCNATARKVARHARQVAAQQLWIDHDTPFRSLRLRQILMVASYCEAAQVPR